MTENEIVNEAAPVTKKSGGVKEWFRKRIVKLKRKPQTIAMIFLLISTVFWLCSLNPVSYSIAKNDSEDNKLVGFVFFVTTLLSILVLVAFLNAFPKRKKANKIYLAVMFVFIALMVVCDLVYYVQFNNYLENYSNYTAADYRANPQFDQSLNIMIIHIILLGVAALSVATLPLYKKLIMKINTRKEIETTELKEEIDTSAEV